MGVNNKQRRAARRRKRNRAGAPRPGGPGVGSGSGPGFDKWIVESFDPADPREPRTVAFDLLSVAVHAVAADPPSAVEHARRLTGPDCAAAAHLVGAVAGPMLADLLDDVLHCGWTPSDLGGAVRRRLTPEHLPALAALVTAETGRHPVQHVADEWRRELAALGPADAADPARADGLTLLLGLCAVLSTLPPLPPVLPRPGSAPSATPRAVGADTRQLARVRALLAKAESTDFDEEAEALSAKAQELISRYALAQLLDQQSRAEPAARPGSVVARRVWIDAPYVMAKALLVDAVASANRCRSVVSEQLGASTVIGAADDLDWVELLSTSLLVQAGRAMLRCGRHTDGRGTSRTRSFRRSFLVAYASRIRERLAATTAAAAEQSSGAARLVPLLRRRSEQVDEARDQMFPELVVRETTISNGRGWAAGRAAADLALLDGDLRPVAGAG